MSEPKRSKRLLLCLVPLPTHAIAGTSARDKDKDKEIFLLRCYDYVGFWISTHKITILGGIGWGLKFENMFDIAREFVYLHIKIPPLLPLARVVIGSEKALAVFFFLWQHCFHTKHWMLQGSLG